MQAGELRHRITLYSQTPTRSKTGAVKLGEPQKVKTLWAKVSPLSVKDVLQAGAVGSTLKARAVIRYQQGITSQMQVGYDGKRFLIDGEPLPDNQTGREYLTLMLASVE